MDRLTLLNKIKTILSDDDMVKLEGALEKSSTSEIRRLYNSCAYIYNLTADLKLPIDNDNETNEETSENCNLEYFEENDDGIIGGTISVSEEESSPSIVSKRLAAFLEGTIPAPPARITDNGNSFDSYIQQKANAELMNYASEMAKKNSRRV